jgi:hypothetical protein
LDALTLAERMDDFERVERLLADNERRQATLLQDYERRRELGPLRQMRTAATIIHDVQIATRPT